MFQFGFYVPAEKYSSSLYNYIAFGGTVEDRANEGLSGFGAEITDLIEFLSVPDPILILLDEFGKSTSYKEGLAILSSLGNYFLSHKKGLVIFAGHMDKILVNQPFQALRTKGLNKLKLEKELKESKNKVAILKNCMDYGIEEGTVTSSDAVTVAEFLGLQKEITDKAKQYLGESK